MLIELTEAILDSLKANGLDVREIGFKDLIDRQLNLTRPAVNISINQARAEQVTLTTYKYRLTVSLVIIFGHLMGGARGEGKRKEGIYKLIESISDFLTLQNFGLALENPMIPMGFRNITTYDVAKAGYQIYELQFWASYNVTKQDTDDLGTLNSILAMYWLKPHDNVLTDSTRASDYIT